MAAQQKKRSKSDKRASQVLLRSRGQIYKTVGVSGKRYNSQTIGSIALPDAAGFLTVVSHMAAVGGAAAMLSGAALLVHLSVDGGVTGTSAWDDFLAWIKKELPNAAGDAIIAMLKILASRIVGFFGGIIIAGALARQLQYNLSYLLFIVGIFTWLPPFRAGLYYAAAIYALAAPLPPRERIVAFALAVGAFFYFTNPFTAGILAPPSNETSSTTTESSNLSGR